MPDHKTVHKPPRGKLLGLGLFGLRLDVEAFYAQFTFRNIVVTVSALAVFLFIGLAISWRFAFLLAILAAAGVVVRAELASRRQWEQFMGEQLQRLVADHERLIRDVARARNDTGALRQELAEAGGALAKSYDTKPAGMSAERHMVTMIAEQLQKLAVPAQGGMLPPGDVLALGFDPGVFANAPEMAEAGRQLSDEQVLQLVNAAVENERVDLFLQPIVALPQRKPRFYETSSRILIAKGVYLSAARYVEIAARRGLIPVIDNLLLLRGLQLVRAVAGGEYGHAFFFNISSLTLHDPRFMNDLVEFIAQNRNLAPLLVFELSQHDLMTLDPATRPVLDGLARLGCRFSMDKVRHLSFDYDYLEELHIRFVKIEAALLLAELNTQGGADRLKRMKASLDRAGIDMIVEKIETDRQLLELLDIEVDYGQGYLFGKPARYGEAALS